MLKDLPSSLVQLRNAVWTGDTRDTMPVADITIAQESIERQGRSKLIVIHACEIISRINIPRPAEAELLEGLESAGPQRINDATNDLLYENQIRARNRYELEVFQE